AQWIPHDLCYVTLYGADGGATIEWGGSPAHPHREITVWTEMAGMPAELQPVVGEDARHAAAVASFLQKVSSGQPAAHDGSDALRRARAIDACYASADAGREVAVAACTPRRPTAHTRRARTKGGPATISSWPARPSRCRRWCSDRRRDAVPGAHSPGSGGMASGFSSSHFSTASASWPSSNWLTTMSSSEPNCSSVIFAWE